MISASSLSTCGWIPSWPVWLSIARPDPLSLRTHLPAAVFPPGPGKSTSKDWGKEGVQYLSIYTVLFSQVSCFIQQGVHIFFSCPFVTFSCSSQGSEMAFPSLSAVLRCCSIPTVLHGCSVGRYNDLWFSSNKHCRMATAPSLFSNYIYDSPECELNKKNLHLPYFYLCRYS